MPIRVDGPAEDPDWVEWDGGLTWLAHPDERMRRASHAVRVDGAPGGGSSGPSDPVLVVEPLDAPGLDDRLADLGTVAGVVVCSEFHRRDAAAVARRHDVPVYLHERFADRVDEVDARVETFEEELGATGFRAVSLYGGRFWGEVALYRAADGTLATAEALTTAPDMRRAGERLAVIPYVRLFPPRAALSGLDVDRVLVGHGRPVREAADEAVSTALSSARRGAPAAVLGNLGYLLGAMALLARD